MPTSRRKQRRVAVSTRCSGLPGGSCRTIASFGFVATCAPNEYRGGHVSDAPNDLMWAGDGPWVFPPVLDVGRDDYFGHGRKGCPDLAKSAWLMNSWKWW